MAVLGIIGTANAQKLALIEEFSGENCGPCASQNPGFMTLIEAPGNQAKVLLLKYQSPIPSAGPIYLANTAFTDARMGYYQVGFAPYARINGDHEVAENNPTAIQEGAVGMVGYAQQSDIDNAAAESTNFTMSISDPVYVNNGQMFTSTVTVTATAATTESNTKLRVALAEELQYNTPPGNNGETHFQNVVRQMYPNADGQAIDVSWTAGQTRTYIITGAVPSYVNDSPPSVFLAAFLQNDTTQEILQATRTTGNIDIEKSETDVSITSVSLEGSILKCDIPTLISGAEVTIKNTGSVALTSATIQYRVANDQVWQSVDWTGNLSSGQTQLVEIPTFEGGESAGLSSIEFEVINPNGVTDYNDYDNKSTDNIIAFIGEPQEFPAFNDFETESDPNWFEFVENNNQYPLRRVRSASETQNLGYDNSVWALYYPSPYLPTGTRGYYMLPKVDLPDGEKSLNFYLSYAVRATTQGDKLEVLSSSDCGVTWEVIWEAQGSDLATTEQTPSNTLHIPNANTWEMISVDITDKTGDDIFAFRATSGGSNYIFIDNVQFTNPLSIDKIMDLSELKLFPNPTTDELNVSLNMKISDNVNFSIINANGQLVMSADEFLSEGNQQTTLNVSNLATGVYILNIQTEGGVTQRKFVKN